MVKMIRLKDNADWLGHRTRKDGSRAFRMISVWIEIEIREEGKDE